MQQFIEHCFSWPSLPASLLLLSVCGYWLLTLFGIVSTDLLDFDFDLDLDMDLDADPSILQFGFLPLKFLNIGSVPTMLWLSVFALAAWMVSRLWNSPLPHPAFVWSTDPQAILRDFGIATILTKIITQPLRGRFDPVEPNKAVNLIGRKCVVLTSEVTDTFGEAELATEAAPLRLKIRNSERSLTRGDVVEIVDVREEDNVYFVTKAEPQDGEM